MNDLTGIGAIGEALVNRVAEGVGAWLRPRQVVRMAKADAEALAIRAEAEASIAERAEAFRVARDVRKQKNMENVLTYAVPELQHDSEPGKIDDDWLRSFFEFAGQIGDEDMQKVWGRLLASKASRGSKFARRTLRVLADLEPSDARLFNTLCSFIVEDTLGGTRAPWIVDDEAAIYVERGITQTSLRHLDTLGLITYQPLGYMTSADCSFTLSYAGEERHLEVPDGFIANISATHAVLTEAGEQLQQVCVPEYVPGFMDYVVERTKSQIGGDADAAQERRIEDDLSAVFPFVTVAKK